MKMKDLAKVVYGSVFDGVLVYGIVAEEGRADALERNEIVEACIAKYAEREVKRIFAEDNMLVFVLKKEEN